MDEMDKISAGRQEKVYAEASQWVRLGNTVIWVTGSLFVPSSFGAVWIGAQHTELAPICAASSISLILVWLGAFYIYAQSSRDARSALISIEDQWGLTEEQRFYKRQKALFSRPFNVQALHVLVLLVLVGLWAYVLLTR